jgi:hypothetical protein
LAKLRNVSSEFKSFVRGKVTFDGETINYNLPQPKSSRHIANLAARLHRFVKG